MKMKHLTLAAVALLVGATGAAVAGTSNSLTVNGTAALGGTSNGLEVFMDEGAVGDAVYVQSNEPVDETHMSVIWRMKISNMPDTPTTGPGRNVRFMTWHEDDGGAGRKVFFLQRQATGNWRIAIWSWNDVSDVYEFSGGFFFGPNASANDYHLKCDWTQATSDGGGDGMMVCYKEVDANPFGSAKLTRTTNEDGGAESEIGSVRLGFLDFDSYPKAGQGDGSLYLDEYESYR